MKQLLPRLAPSLLALLLVSSAQALECRFLAWDEKVAERQLAVVSDGKEDAPVKDLHPLKRSPGVNAKLTEGILFLRSLDRQDAQGKPVDFSVKLAGNMARPLVLLLPDPKAASGLRGYALEDDVANFPWGTFRFLNVTGRELAVMLGDLRKPIPANWQPLDLLPAGNKPLPVQIAMKEPPNPNQDRNAGANPNAHQLKTVFSSVWKADPDVRRLVFLVPGSTPRLGPLDIKVIPEDRKLLELGADAANGGGAEAEAGAAGGSGASSRSAEGRSDEEP